MGVAVFVEAAKLAQVKQALIAAIKVVERRFFTKFSLIAIYARNSGDRAHE
jgi:hypothetical protein